MRENLTKPLTIESFAEYPDKMDSVNKKAIEAQLFKSGQVEKYREKKIKKVMKIIKKEINQQYSYTGREAIATFKDERGDFNWLPSKEGQSIKQWWIDRINQQRSASKLTKSVPMGCFAVHDNDDKTLDNKIREHICDLDIHQEVDFEDDGDGNEWVLTNVEDLYHELNFYPSSASDILNNKEFMKLWFERVKSSKLSYFDKETISEPYQLRPWQDLVVEGMLSSNKKFHQLGIAYRHGKTVTVLDYTKKKVLRGDYDGSKLYLVPTSKSLASNASFVKDYDRFGFKEHFNIIKDLSLFKNEDKIIEKLLKILPEDAMLILVTDEADLASHTIISIDKINLIKKTFNVVEQLVMTGTGIGKASKIFKDIPLEDINFIYQTYDDMVEMGGEVVRRRYWNVPYELITEAGEKVLNITQTLADPAHHEQLSKYLYSWTLDKVFEKRLELIPTEIVMVFVNSELNKHMEELVDTYETMYSDKVKCLVLTGRTTSNRKAEKLVKKTYQTMRKNKDYRKLVVFSNGIAARSFSFGKIYRELNFCDGYITDAKLHQMARVLTWEEGKLEADIIRFGCLPMDLPEQIFLSENELPGYGEKSYSKVERFLTNNSFVDVLVSDGVPRAETLFLDGVDNKIVGQFIDNIQKFSDTTSYISARLWEENIQVDADITIQKSKKLETASLNTKGKKSGKKIKVTKKTGKLTKRDEEKLKQYVNIMRCIPSIAIFCVGVNNFDDFISSGEWENYLNIDKDIFMENYNNSDEFKGQVDSLFRYGEKKTTEEHKQRLQEYMRFI